LVLFPLRGFGEGDDAGVANVNVLVETLDGAALTGSITAFENNEVAFLIIH